MFGYPKLGFKALSARNRKTIRPDALKLIGPTSAGNNTPKYTHNYMIVFTSCATCHPKKKSWPRIKSIWRGAPSGLKNSHTNRRIP